MHGLVNRGLQNFLVDRHGVDVWAQIALRAGAEPSGFEAMLIYEDALTDRVIDAAAWVLARSRDDVLEDFGIFLVAHPATEAVRRLLRFGGVDFVDFLHSLDDLPDRARLAVPGLSLPRLELRAHAAGHFSLICDAPISGFGHVMIGVLRVMADDYGALALLDLAAAGDGVETLSITLIEADFARGRDFDLGARVA